MTGDQYLPETAKSPEPPPRLKDRYRLVEWLGEGSMGLVYRAHDETLDREVAIKLLSPKHITSSEASERFLREARAVARLSHPNIMALYDVDRDGAWHYLVLEYIPGQDLHARLLEQNGPLPISETLEILRGLLEALAYAHAQGLIHRDIKPENIRLTPEDKVKVTDFGLALAQGDARLTRDDMIVGTVLYLAPEVVTGNSPDHRTDLYAVGAVLYELLTGQPPFSSDNPVAILSQILSLPITPLRTINQNIPAALEGIVTKLLAKDPADRYASAEAVLAALPDPTQAQAAPISAASQPSAQQPALSRLERIVRSSSTTLQKQSPAPSSAPDEESLLALPDDEEIAQPHLTQALLVYAALEDTVEAVEAERHRLAQLLQSNVVESLNLLLAQVNAYEQTLGANPAARMALSVLASLARQLIQEVRDLSDNLHPAILETLGLEPALEALATQMQRSHGLQITLNTQRLNERLPPQVELALFRIAQNVLERAVRQAHATQVTINLDRRDEQLRFGLSDNGRGVTDDEVLRQAHQRIEQLGGAVETGRSPHGGFSLTIRFALEAPVQLTPREMEVIQLLTEGLSNKEIARLLSVSPRTVNFHLDNIYSKLGVSSRTEAAIYALRQGWGRRPV